MNGIPRVLVPIGILLSVLACSRPPLHVVQDGSSIVIDLQSLGEYPSDVAGIRLIEHSRKEVVWEVNGRNSPRLGRIKLRVGKNSVLPSDIRHGQYEVVTPSGEQTFTIAPATRYVVEVWRSDASPHEKRIGEFSTPG